MKRSRAPQAQDVLERARKHGYAVGAFNVSDLVMLKGVALAAHKLRAPVIIETSSGETDFIGAGVQVAVLDRYEEELGIPILINLDHAKTATEVRKGIAAGYELVHFDGSHLPKATNIRILKTLAHEAHQKKLLIEGELDHITGSSEWHKTKASSSAQAQGVYTDPAEAAEFVRKTNVDILASFIGNVHGVYRTPPRLDFDRLTKIRKAVPCYLSLHGGSGTRPQDFRRAVRLGVSKINISTELRIAYTVALRASLQANRNEVAPYKIFPPVVAAVQRVVEGKIRLFGSAGKA